MIRFIEDASERRKISRQVLEALPEWFELKESREQYIRESAEQPFWASMNGDENQGFLCLKETGKATMELAVMGVRKECHRKGIGRRLFAAAKDYAARKGYEFIQVKTVRSGVYADYDITNVFYQSLGFKELEVFPKYWDEANPCQIYVMSLKNAINTISTRHSYRGEFLQESVPEEDDVVCILPVGKAKDDFHAPSKKPLSERVRFNRWSQ